MMKMPKEMKEKWITALRSGEYKQAVGSLKKGNAYCCLGVLEMVCDGDVEYGFPLGKPTVDNQIFGSLKLPSPEWIESHGLPEDDNTYKLLVELSNRNDGGNGQERHNFEQIADYIEKNVEAAE